MGLPVDDFDLESVEEFYSARNLQLVRCDTCKERVTARGVHLMNSFIEPDVELIVCPRCYNKMTGKKEI